MNGAPEYEGKCAAFDYLCDQIHKYPGKIIMLVKDGDEFITYSGVGFQEVLWEAIDIYEKEKYSRAKQLRDEHDKWQGNK